MGLSSPGGSGSVAGERLDRSGVTPIAPWCVSVACMATARTGELLAALALEASASPAVMAAAPLGTARASNRGCIQSGRLLWPPGLAVLAWMASRCTERRCRASTFSSSRRSCRRCLASRSGRPCASSSRWPWSCCRASSSGCARLSASRERFRQCRFVRSARSSRTSAGLLASPLPPVPSTKPRSCIRPPWPPSASTRHLSACARSRCSTCQKATAARARQRMASRSRYADSLR
mmetsp:Transcript_38157/g.118523  ORF Transcript_38157/g.118523 Transcript_38157/m.118523 type:complete len:235 (-) Transcript_38157:435-1139(-)